MSEESTAEGTPNTNNVTENPSGTGSAQNVSDLDDWAQKLIRETRAEAADYRTRLRSAKDEVRGEIQVEFESKYNELKSANDELAQKLSSQELNSTKLQVALDAGLGGKQALLFADRLRGTTREELEADAKSALELFNTVTNSTATDPTQGLGSGPKQTPSEMMGDFFAQQLGF